MAAILLFARPREAPDWCSYGSTNTSDLLAALSDPRSLCCASAKRTELETLHPRHLFHDIAKGRDKNNTKNASLLLLQMYPLPVAKHKT